MTAVDGAVVFRVLTDPTLFRGIVCWSDGWPGLVALRWREIQAARNGATLTPRDFFLELVSQRDRRVLEAFMSVHRTPFLLVDISAAIESGDADIVRLAHSCSGRASDELRRHYWTLAVRTFPGHVEVLEALSALEPLDWKDECLWVPNWSGDWPLLYDAHRIIAYRDHAYRQWIQATGTIGSVVLAEWLVAKFGALCLSRSLLHAAVQRGNPTLVRCMATVPGQDEIEPSDFVSLYRLSRHQKEGGHSEILDFLLRQYPEIDSCELEAACFDSGDVETLALLLRARGLSGLQAVDFGKAIDQGNLDVIHFVVANTPTTCTSDVIDHAAANGNLDIFERLRHLTGVSCTTGAMDGAAGNGRLDVVEFLHKERREGCTTRAMDAAAARGFLHIVEFLHENRHEGCTTHAMDQAAQNGHLNIVRYLHENRLEGCTTQALDQAGRNGHLRVVQFLHENRHEGCSAAAFKYPSLTLQRTDPKRTAMVRSTLLYLLEHRAEMHNKSVEYEALRARDLDMLTRIHQLRGLQFLRDVDIDDLAGDGKIELIRFLVTNASVTCTRMAMAAAAAYNHLDVVVYLHETRAEGCTTAAMDLAAMGGHWEIVSFLDEHRREGFTAVVLIAAVRLGRLELVQRYSKRAPTSACSAALAVASLYGRRDIQDVLRSNAER